MASAKVTCQIHVQKIEDNGRTQKIAMKSLRNCPDIGVELRIRWATELMKHFEQPPEPITSIRPWDFVAKMDGSVESLPNPVLTGDLCEGYPARFQIPSCTLDGLNHEEKVRRAEMFAMACLLYEIMSGRKPFEELADDKVQHRFMNGDVPNDAATLPNSLFMFSGWSEEFAQELQRRVDRQKTLGIVRKAGIAVAVVSFLAVPALGIAGFGVLGPAAGSVAAAWQGSMGAVQAGSLFAWCQSAAMGGAAAGSINAVGVAGTAVAGLSKSAKTFTMDTPVADIPGLVEMFKKVFRTGNQNR